jgi:hypothetical protein
MLGTLTEMSRARCFVSNDAAGCSRGVVIAAVIHPTDA